MRRFLISCFLMLQLLCAYSASAQVDITSRQRSEVLRTLDDSLKQRTRFIERRQQQIDLLVDSMKRTGVSENLVLAIADKYTGFNNDSALHYFAMGQASPVCMDKLPYMLGRAKLLPLNGFFSPAVDIFNSIDTTQMSDARKIMYYDAGRQMYSYMSAFSASDPTFKADYNAHALACQKRLLELLPQGSLEYDFNLGEYYFLTGSQGRARALLEHVLEDAPQGSPFIARAAHHLSTICVDNDDAYTYYLARSAMADLSAATREVASLQELGNHLYLRNDLNRAYYYLSEALASAVECAAPLRMIESSRSLPIISRAYDEQLQANRRVIYIIVVVLVIVIIVLAVTMLLLYKKMKYQRQLQDGLRKANRIKEVYISQFLNLCSIYMDKLNQFCKFANRKIAAGKVDDLYRLTKSGKFVEEQSREFYEVFDNAFLHIYPDFVKQVNALLRADAQIELRDGEQLNTDLRILAFMRLGIEESSRIAQVLNYSLNTIYAYRNRTRARAINRETFESDVMNIQSIN